MSQCSARRAEDRCTLPEGHTGDHGPGFGDWCGDKPEGQRWECFRGTDHSGYHLGGGGSRWYSKPTPVSEPKNAPSPAAETLRPEPPAVAEYAALSAAWEATRARLAANPESERIRAMLRRYEGLIQAVLEGAAA